MPLTEEKIVDGDAHREWSSKMHLKSIGAIGSDGFLKKKIIEDIRI